MHHKSAFVAVLAIANVFNIPIVNAKKVLRLPFEKSALDAYDSVSSTSSPNNSARHHKRTSIQARLGNQIYSYAVNVTIGTPPQQFKLLVDTGSSDLWVESSSSNLCNSTSKPCAASGTYDNTTSSTYSYLNSMFNISYADGTYAIGDYIQESLNFGGAIIQTELGYATNTTLSRPVLGIGFSSDEAIVSENCTLNTPCASYPNLPIILSQQGYTNSAAYSLYLNDVAATSGVILFGGIDTAKFVAPLVTIGVNYGGPANQQFSVSVNKVSQTVNKTASNFNSTNGFSAILDSGSSVTFLPGALFSSIVAQLGLSYNAGGDFYYSACSTFQNLTGTLDFHFAYNSSFASTTDASIIRVPYSQFYVPFNDASGAPLKNSVGQPLCAFGAFNGGSNGPFVLGDTFLRSAYVVFDLDNMQISMAQTVFDQTKSNVQEIKAGPGGVPGAISGMNGTVSSSITTTTSTSFSSSSTTSTIKTTTSGVRSSATVTASSSSTTFKPTSAKMNTSMSTSSSSPTGKTSSFVPSTTRTTSSITTNKPTSTTLATSVRQTSKTTTTSTTAKPRKSMLAFMIDTSDNDDDMSSW